MMKGLLLSATLIAIFFMSTMSYTVQLGHSQINVNNVSDDFSSKMMKKFDLKKHTRKMRVKVKKRDSKTSKQKEIIDYEYHEYLNRKKKTLVWFQRDGSKRLEPKFSTIFILSADKNEVVKIANFFLTSSNAGKSLKKRWGTKISKISFKPKAEVYKEYAGVPNIRCTSQKLIVPASKGAKKHEAYYLEINIVS